MLKQYTARLTPLAPTLLRVMVGLTFVMHGIPKVQGPTFFIGYVERLGFPIPTVLAILVTFLEAMGGLMLIVGIGTRWVALLFAIEMTVTTLVVKMPNLGFIAPGGQPGTGAELDLLLLVGSLVLVLLGPGRPSLEVDLLKSE